MMMIVVITEKNANNRSLKYGKSLDIKHPIEQILTRQHFRFGPQLFLVLIENPFTLTLNQHVGLMRR